MMIICSLLVLENFIYVSISAKKLEECTLHEQIEHKTKAFPIRSVRSWNISRGVLRGRGFDVEDEVEKKPSSSWDEDGDEDVERRRCF